MRSATSKANNVYQIAHHLFSHSAASERICMLEEVYARLITLTSEHCAKNYSLTPDLVTIRTAQRAAIETSVLTAAAAASRLADTECNERCDQQCE